MADYLLDGTRSSSDPPPSGTHFSALVAGDAALGVAPERVDPRTLQLFQDLFPGEHGIQFLARLLRQAQVKQLALPDVGLAEMADVAVVRAQSLRVLAKHIGLGYDTTEKYIVLLCQLKLLYKHRSRQEIVLHFPLQAPRLPEPEVLDHLEAYRPKVAQFARQVKRRYVKLRASKKGDFYVVRSSRASTDPLVLMPAAAVAGNTSLSHQVVENLLDDFDTILQQEEKVDSDTKSRLFARLGDALRLHYSQAESRLFQRKGDFSHQNEERHTHKESTFASQKGDSFSSSRPVTSEESCLSAEKDDSETIAAWLSPIRKRQLLSQKDDFPTFKSPLTEGTFDAERRLSHQKDDFSARGPASKGDSDTPKRQLSLTKDDFPSQKGDSNAFESMPNVNVETFITKITLNVNVGAHFFCQIFGEKPSKQNVYKGVFAKIGHNARAILGAYLVTLAHQHEGTIKNPASFFLSRCKAFNEALTEEAEELIVRYGTLPHDQVCAALFSSQESSSAHVQTQIPQSVAAVPAVSSRVSRPVFVSGTPRPPEVTLRIPARPGGGMDRATAERLSKTMRADLRMLGTSIKLLRLRDMSYAVLVSVDDAHKVRQVIFYSEQEWVTRSATITRGVQLFSQGGK